MSNEQKNKLAKQARIITKNLKIQRAAKIDKIIKNWPTPKLPTDYCDGRR